MSADLQELKRLAQAATQRPGCNGVVDVDVEQARDDFRSAANPAAVLALIERMERAEVEAEPLRERVQGAQEEAYEALDAARAANVEAGRRSALVGSLTKRAESAEADNAALLEMLHGAMGCFEGLAQGAAEEGRLPAAGVMAMRADLLRAVVARTHPGTALLERAFKFEGLARAALLAFLYIDDRSAGSSEAWDALARALGMDPEESYVAEMVAALRTMATAPEGR